MTNNARTKRRERRSRPKPDAICSFCGKNQRQVKHLIAGPDVAICDECIAECNKIISGLEAAASSRS